MLLWSCGATRHCSPQLIASPPAFRRTGRGAAQGIDECGLVSESVAETLKLFSDRLESDPSARSACGLQVKEGLIGMRAKGPPSELRDKTSIIRGVGLATFVCLGFSCALH